jgi:hypothetical protein
MTTRLTIVVGDDEYGTWRKTIPQPDQDTTHMFLLKPHIVGSLSFDLKFTNRLGRGSEGGGYSMWLISSSHKKKQKRRCLPVPFCISMAAKEVVRLVSDPVY